MTNHNMNIERKRFVRRKLSGKPCAICGLDIKREDFSIDHIIPISKGGRNILKNLQPAHKWCNLEKGNKHV